MAHLDVALPAILAGVAVLLIAAYYLQIPYPILPAYVRAGTEVEHHVRLRGRVAGRVEEVAVGVLVEPVEEPGIVAIEHSDALRSGCDQLPPFAVGGEIRFMAPLDPRMPRTGRPRKPLAELLLEGTLRPRHRELLARARRPATVPPDVWALARRRFGLSYNPMHLVPSQRS